MVGSSQECGEDACATCPFRAFSLCGNVLDELEGVRQTTVPRLRGAAPPRQILYEKSCPSQEVQFLCRGWAFRFVQFSDGRRQILSLIMPGEIFSTAAVFADRLHFSVLSVTDVRFTSFPRETVRQALDASPVMEHLGGLCASEMQEKDLTLADLGRRSADERIAHFVLRLIEKLTLRGEGDGNRFPCPLRQQHIADLTGLTQIHVSRVLSSFRQAGIFDLSRSILTVQDPVRLERIGRPR